MNEVKPNEDELKRLELATKQAELQNKKWELFFKWIGLLTVVFGIAWPVFQYTKTLQQAEADRQGRAEKDTEQREKAIKTARREAQRPFLELQLKLYVEAVTVAGRLATLENGAEREAARKRFYQLYWGELSVVEDREVEIAMVRFNQALEAFERAAIPERAKAKAILNCRSLRLAHNVRDSLARTWEYDRGEQALPAATPEPDCDSTYD
ncbi:MAG: hypothetical protein M3X11_15555 [Acidobacteriota bacterium]|nr:hypothetical protein [Acidobacteriota bacterium]